MPYSACYNVSTWYPQATNFATNTLMFVNGTTNAMVVTVNQRTNGGAWYPLATNLYYAIGTNGNVTIYNQTGSTNYLVAANAMKWSYNPAQDSPSNDVPPLWWSSFYYGTNYAEAVSNYAEYVFGTTPSDTNDTPDFWIAFPASNTVTVTFAPYLGGRDYQLQTSGDLSQSKNWVTLTNQPTTSTDGNGYGVFTLTQTNPVQSFYRISASVVPY